MNSKPLHTYNGIEVYQSSQYANAWYILKLEPSPDACAIVAYDGEMLMDLSVLGDAYCRHTKIWESPKAGHKRMWEAILDMKRVTARQSQTHERD